MYGPIETYRGVVYPWHEVFAGSLVHVTTELLEVGRRSLRLVHRMYDSASDEEVATTEIVTDRRRRGAAACARSAVDEHEAVLQPAHGHAGRVAEVELERARHRHAGPVGTRQRDVPHLPRAVDDEVRVHFGGEASPPRTSREHERDAMSETR